MNVKSADDGKIAKYGGSDSENVCDCKISFFHLNVSGNVFYISY